MAPRSRSNGLQRWGVPIAIVVIAVLGAGLVYAAAQRWSAAPPVADIGPPPPGHTAVPISTRALPAFTRIELEHLVDPATGTLAAIHIPTESLLDVTMTSPQELVGRVLAGDKAAGQVFTETELMPPGTRPGIVAGIPPGKRAVRLEAGRVSGLVGLRRGDRFDLVASGGRSGGPGRSGMSRGRTVAEDGVVVEPARARRSVTDGRIVEEIVVAVDPAEVVSLTSALESGQRIDTFPRSGQATADAPEPTARDRSHHEIVEIDLIKGTRRTIETAPGGPPPPDVAAGPAS